MRESVQSIMQGVNVKEGTRVKRVANNTVQYTRPDGAESIRLHHTDVVVKHPDGTVELNSGGWRTATTKARLNAYSPAGVYSAKGIWYVNGKTPFFDGIKLQGGKVLNGAKADTAAKKDKKLIAAINLFVRKLDDMTQLPAPSIGDCWYCSMFQRETPPGKVEFNHHAGQSGPCGNGEHLRSHVQEGYLHGSLIMNALVWAGYGNPALVWQMENVDRARGGRKPDMVKRALRRYLRRKLGVG